MMPTEQFLESYYRDYYNESQTKVTVGRPDGLSRHIAQLLPENLKPTLTLLDFGGGDGTLAKVLVKRLRQIYPKTNFEITLVDFNQEKSEENNFFTFRSETRLTAVKNQEFDIILASAIIEHVPEAHQLIQELFDLLAKEGTLYVRTPFVSPLKKLFRRYPLKYPMHVHDIGPSFWNRVAERYSYPLDILVSQPSMVASGFSGKEWLRSCVAHTLKFPAHLENRFRAHPRDYFWNMMGGWEILFRKRK
ncbi:MAG: class I SAM-dependent methyltransferase [Proteobacteria bacterium]|nr:class I SAM-dependent methyltransferase [Pseudomonadota bacterium]